jgi:hypothetical protein
LIAAETAVRNPRQSGFDSPACRSIVGAVQHRIEQAQHSFKRRQLAFGFAIVAGNFDAGGNIDCGSFLDLDRGRS